MILPMDVIWDKMTDQQFIAYLQELLGRYKILMILFLLGGILIGWCFHKAYSERNSPVSTKPVSDDKQE